MTSAGTARAHLSSSYDAERNAITLRLHAHRGFDAGWRLAVTSVAQLTPSPGFRLVERLASFHLIEPETPRSLEAGDEIEIEVPTLSHRPRHANEGPASGYLVLADGTTEPVTVGATQLVGTDRGPTTDHDADAEEGHSVPMPALVPYPAEMSGDGSRRTGWTARLLTDDADVAVAWDAVAALAERHGRSAVLNRTDGDAANDSSTIEVVVDRRTPVIVDPHGEGYELDITGDRAVVGASTTAGIRHAFVTLAQLLLDGLPNGGTVRDAPRYSWRGLHIDLARQWFEPSVVDHLIDRAAWLKLSRLHLHLTDDEGWRLPVDGFPELGRVAGTRGHGLPVPPFLGGGPEPTGRCYTAGEIAGWNARAAALGVTLVPEVDLPAHVHAALTALPDLRDPDDTSGAVSVQFFTDNVLVPGHDPTADFVDAVVASVCRLFPDSPWIHIGGDEVPDGAWTGSPIVERFRVDLGLTDDDDPEAQRRAVEAAFHRDLVATVARHGRAVGAWQEAAESGGVRPGDGYVVGWRTIEANRTLAQAGHDVVVSPGQAYYLDMAVDDRWETPGASWAGSTSVADIAAFDPADGWTREEREHLLGVQACLWTEFVHDADAVRDRLTARLDAIAEHAWTGSVVGGVPSLTRRVRSLNSGARTHRGGAE